MSLSILDFDVFYYVFCAPHFLQNVCGTLLCKILQPVAVRHGQGKYGRRPAGTYAHLLNAAASLPLCVKTFRPIPNLPARSLNTAGTLPLCVKTFRPLPGLTAHSLNTRNFMPCCVKTSRPIPNLSACLLNAAGTLPLCVKTSRPIPNLPARLLNTADYPDPFVKTSVRFKPRLPLMRHASSSSASIRKLTGRKPSLQEIIAERSFFIQFP